MFILLLLALVGCDDLLSPDKNKLRDEFVAAAKTYIGTAYRLGEESREATDCSGLIYAVCKDIGHPIHRISARRLAETYKTVEGEHGDLPTFSHNGATIAHIGIWADDTRLEMVHASSSKGVIQSEVNQYYWKPRLMDTVKCPAIADLETMILARQMYILNAMDEDK